MDQPADTAATGHGAVPAGSGAVPVVADAVLAHPSVARLDAGPFGSIASYFPGRRVPGVRIGVGDEPVEIAVVARLGVPFDRLADEIAARVRSVLGPVPVDVTFCDVVAEAPQPSAQPSAAPGRTEPGGLT